MSSGIRGSVFYSVVRKGSIKTACALAAATCMSGVAKAESTGASTAAPVVQVASEVINAASFTLNNSPTVGALRFSTGSIVQAPTIELFNPNLTVNTPILITP